MWTMEQLVERVSAALAAEYPGAPNGRVREVPDRRSIRWYTTIGLVDRPLGTRGRTVLYGPRHLLQLVAIKRRQAAGRTLAEIQEELGGASEETLAAVARVPDRVLISDEPPPSPPASRAPFWKAAPAAADPLSVDAYAPAADTDTDTDDLDQEPASGATRRELAAVLEALDVRRPPMLPLITGVPLGDGVILLLPRHTADLDRDDIAAAARPLLDLLASRGLTDGRTS
ncbi:MerR HTH family regulatory protein [Actinoplanes philippinensis]|uniref:MerR HTH family regulatory protein n=2 Tax=Actinoplanes philippinensis TaxID=35752 RepID=A0A1I2NCE3_9ACTN|nr:MerR HTH family regulatory protein [Actinoplanes philippinensis]